METERRNTNEQLVIGLKTEVKRQGGIRRQTEEVCSGTQMFLMRSWKRQYENIYDITDCVDLEDEIWNYVDYLASIGQYVWVHTHSSNLGIYSKIADYTNKKGITSLAHYTINGKYLGSVSKMGLQPVSYQGNFPVCRDKWNINLRYFDNEPILFNGVCLWERMFEPKSDVEKPRTITIKPKKKTTKKAKLVLVEEDD